MVGQKKKSENPMPIVDDGWWASVLAEESRHAPPPPIRQGGKPEVRDEAQASSPVQAKHSADWGQVKDLYLRDQIVDLNVTGYNRGGLLVEGNNLYGFVPFSHLVELAGKNEISQREHDLETFVGRTLRLKVIECVPEDGRIVFSERAALSEPGKRTELFGALHPGEHVNGTVTNITDFGVFVDLGGVEGLIHTSEMPLTDVKTVKDLVFEGLPVQVRVLHVDAAHQRMGLSMRL